MCRYTLDDSIAGSQYVDNILCVLIRSHFDILSYITMVNTSVVATLMEDRLVAALVEVDALLNFFWIAAVAVVGTGAPRAEEF